MNAIVEDTEEASALRIWGLRIAIVLGVLALLVFLFMQVQKLMSGSSGPKRQTAKIALLPDTPPPPPPPPKEEKKPEPKEEKAMPQPLDQPKQITPPEPQQLKMEGPAGDAPSPFAGGDVKNDYIGGDIGNGNGRLKFAFYTNNLEQEIQQALSDKKLHGASLKVLLWLGADGSVQRYTLADVSASADGEKTLRNAFAEFTRVREAPPADMPMPVGLQVTVR